MHLPIIFSIYVNNISQYNHLFYLCTYGYLVLILAFLDYIQTTAWEDFLRVWLSHRDNDWDID